MFTLTVSTYSNTILLLVMFWVLHTLKELEEKVRHIQTKVMKCENTLSEVVIQVYKCN